MDAIQMTNEEYKAEYKKRRDEVLRYIDDSIQTLSSWQTDTPLDNRTVPLQRLRDNVEQGLFSIVLVGEFSAGKSTFLNAIMHRRILPSFSSETTATVNFLRSIDRAPEEGLAGRVYYVDGRTADINDLSLESLEKIVSTKGNDGYSTVAATVDRVELFLDSDFLKEGVMLVDSPGLNGVAEGHTEITERQIKESHACIFVFNAEQPGSATNFKYLKKLKSETNNIFFVLNKIDSINPDEQSVEDVLQAIRNSYHLEFPNEDSLPRIWPVAAKCALAARDPDHSLYRDERADTKDKQDHLESLSQMSDFENRLWEYLTKGERARDQLCSPVENTINTFKNARNRIDEQIQLLESETEGEDLIKKRDTLQASLNEMKGKHQSIPRELLDNIHHILRDAQEKAQRECADVSTRTKRELDTLELPDEVLDYSATLNQNLVSRFTRIATSIQDELRDDLIDAMGTEYEQFVDELEDRMNQDKDSTTFHLPDRQVIIREFSGNIHLDQFEAECAALREKIDTLDEQANKSNLDKIASRRAEREREAAKAELVELQNSKQFMFDNFSFPDIKYRDEDKVERRWRGGLLGFFGTLLFGKKEVHTSERVADDTAYSDAKKTYNARMQELDSQIAKKREEIDSSAREAVSSEEAEFLQKTAERKRDLLEEELHQKQSKFKTELIKSSERVTQKMRVDIINQVSELESSISSDLCKTLRDQEKQCASMVRALLNQTIQREIESLQNQLDSTIKLLSEKGDERNRMLNAAKAARETASEMMSRGADLVALLESEMRAEIEQEAVNTNE